MESDQKESILIARDDAHRYFDHGGMGAQLSYAEPLMKFVFREAINFVNRGKGS